MARKNSAMQDQVEKDELQPDNSDVSKGDQMDLMDHQPKQSKELERIGRLYDKKVKARMALQSGEGGEFELQAKLLELVKAEDLQRDNNGHIKLNIHGVKLELTPTKEKVKVKIDDNN